MGCGASKTQPAPLDKRVAAAELLLGCGTQFEALSALLKELAALKQPPENVNDWLCVRLRNRRPSKVQVYTKPVLPGLMMKCDEFDGIHALKTERVHPAVWNFRRSRGKLPIFGVGQCHLDGLLHIARHLKGAGFAEVIWCNMREEPLIFLDGTGCAPRVEGRLNENVDYLLSIQGHELDAMEARLRDECVEAAQVDEGLQVWWEVEGTNEQRTLQLAKGGRHFPVREAYEWVNAQEGSAHVTYVRVPIADETAPEEQDFDQLVAELKPLALRKGELECALVFNCHMGRGRTTTGMVCGSILIKAARGWSPPAGSPTSLPAPTADIQHRDFLRGEWTRILELLQLVDQMAEATRSNVPSGTSLSSGISLGLRAKLLADGCCDECDEVTNLVTAVQKCADKAEAAEARARTGGDAEAKSGLAEDRMGTPAFWRHRGVKYLERYAYLLLFATYALLEAQNGFELSFSEWSHRHWNFKRLIKELVLS